MDAVYSPVDLLNEQEQEWVVEKLWEVAVMTNGEQAKLHEALRVKGVGELTRLGLLSKLPISGTGGKGCTNAASIATDEEPKPEEKPNKKPGKGRPANPVVEWRREIIRKVSATGVKGEAYCVALGEVRISITKTGLETPVPWQKEKPPCPKSYVNAWNDPDPKQRKKWRQRVANEKSKATRQNPH
jgi:hypothetical protein